MKQIITDFLDETARLYPDRIAYVSPERSVTFSQVRREALHVAAGLTRAGLFRQPVVIYAEKSVEAMIALFGVAYSGNFYTVMDTDMPPARMKKILGTLEPAAFLTLDAMRESACQAAEETPVLVYEELQQQDFDEGRAEQVRRKILPGDLLFVLFTSGSTGVPKGVATSHGAMVNYISCWEEVYRLGKEDRLLSQVPLYFIMADVDMFAPVVFGAQTHFVPGTFYSFPSMLTAYIQEHGITFMNWVPSAMGMVVAMDAFETGDVSSVQKVIFGGEVMPPKVLAAWRRQLPGAMFVNGYGSTEVTDGCLYYRVPEDYVEDTPLPIGIPYPHMDVFLLDEEDHLVTEPGVQGEIVARSGGLAYGYYKDPERTAQVFVPNPLTPAYQEKIYRTGDLGTWDAEGNIRYAGRKDAQIKHMGHRIELGEIESNAARIPGVEEAACLYDSEKSHILLFYTGEAGERAVGTALKELLPAYMQPRRRVRLEQIPRTLSGKVDRQALRNRLESSGT